MPRKKSKSALKLTMCYAKDLVMHFINVPLWPASWTYYDRKWRIKLQTVASLMSVIDHTSDG